MFDDFFATDVRKQRRVVREVNIIPVLNLMVMIIFFLLLTTSFVEFTKKTVPPSSKVTMTDPVRPLPLAPRLLLMKIGGTYRIQMTWQGESPGMAFKVHRMGVGIEGVTDRAQDKLDIDALQILRFTENLVADFLKNYPEEKNIQVGLSADSAYQLMISLMDGAQFGAERQQKAVLFNAAQAQGRKVDIEKFQVKPLNLVLVSYQEANAEGGKIPGETL